MSILTYAPNEIIVTISAMKPIFKKIKYNQSLAEQPYATGNYDAMYLAGMIAEPKKMTEEDFDRWIEGSYFYTISDFNFLFNFPSF